MKTSHRTLGVLVAFGLLMLASVGAEYDPSATQVMTARQLYDQAFALVGESKQAEALETLIVLFKRYPRTSWAIKARGLSRSLEAQISNTYDPQEALASYGYKEPAQLAQDDVTEKQVDEVLYGESVGEELGEKPAPAVASAPPVPPAVVPPPAPPAVAKVEEAPAPVPPAAAPAPPVVAAVVPAPVPAAAPDENPQPASGTPLPPDGRGAGGEGVVAAAIAPVPSEWKEERKESPTPDPETKTAMAAPAAPVVPAVVPIPEKDPHPASGTPLPSDGRGAGGEGVSPAIVPAPVVAPPAPPKPVAVAPPVPPPPAPPAPGTQFAAVQPVPLPAPVITDGEAKRTLTNKDIQEVLSSKIVPIRFCFMKGLEQNPNIRGEVIVAFTVQPDGAVSDARVDSSSLDSDVAEDCLERRVMRMRFPPFDGPPVTKKVPFKFTD